MFWTKASQSLEKLYLNNNNLSGTIDEVTETWKNLRELAISDNHLSGTLPTFRLAKNLSALIASDNYFTGSLPSFYNNSNLVVLSLDNNQFQHKLPILANSMNNLRSLTLHNNQLSDNDLTSWLDKLFRKSPVLSILTLANNHGLVGSIPALIYNSALSALIAHGCSINGQLPQIASNQKSHLLFASLSQNRLSGLMPEHFINQNGTVINNTQIYYQTTFLNWEELLVTQKMSQMLVISPLIEYGLYLSGNRFKQNGEWYKGFSQQTLPHYVPSSERSAENLYITNRASFQQYVIIAIAVPIMAGLLLWQMIPVKCIICTCGCCSPRFPFARQKPSNIGFFKQIEVNVSRTLYLSKKKKYIYIYYVYKLMSNGYVLGVSCLLAVIYCINANFYSEGFPLSQMSLAYVNDPPKSTVGVLIAIVLCTNAIVLGYVLKIRYQDQVEQIFQAYAKEPLAMHSDQSTDATTVVSMEPLVFDGKKWLELCLYLTLWIVTLCCVVSYCVLEAFPSNNTLNIDSNVIFVLQGSLSLLLCLYNSFVAPNLSTLLIQMIIYYRRPSKSTSQWLLTMCTPFLTLLLRGLMCIYLPIVAATYFYDSCGRQWVNYWDLCVTSKPNEVVVEYLWNVNVTLSGENFLWSSTSSANFALPLMYWSDVCRKGFYHNYQYGDCAREIMEKWCNVMILKMVANVIMPWIHVLILKWRNQRQEKVLLTDNVEHASVVSNLEMTILLGLFCPLIIPLCILALLSNYWKYQYLLRTCHNFTLSANNPLFRSLLIHCIFFATVHLDAIVNSVGIAFFLVLSSLMFVLYFVSSFFIVLSNTANASLCLLQLLINFGHLLLRKYLFATYFIFFYFHLFLSFCHCFVEL
ncbi:hypothetical protein RFI_14867 [Reticulomyxa filosa]|uniref:Uncharacterized protein n=1 Tax=Reticulomyxa filosa TaxID=46433 RepID=X6N998_RETFI|nr:hypothetical protein RFI_14867 [Reticulomyxa filosa]|eukprot:ETO22329.1 hypothetical protein RFI_14867 [Reticulomyxa filosa]